MSEAKKLSTLLADDTAGSYAEATMRLTGKSVEQWREEFKRRLVSDIEHGRLNPDRWFLPYHVTSLAERYGFTEPDDFVFDLVDIKIIQSLYLKFVTPIGPQGKVAEKCLAARLNPDKYGHLANMYRSKAMSRSLV